MSSLLFKITASVVGALALAIAAMWVIGLGPFNTRPSVAAKAIPKVQATVAKIQTDAGTAVAKVETKTKAASAAAEKRTEDHVAKIRAAPAGVADREFYRGVCDTQFYAGSADCRGFRSQP